MSGSQVVMEEIRTRATEGLPAIPAPIISRVCRACGCTNDDCSVCIRLSGRPCSWVTDYLCSACVDQADGVLRAYACNGNRATSCAVIYRQARARWVGNQPALAAIERAAIVLREARPNASW